jgi:hypothetical protein
MNADFVSKHQRLSAANQRQLFDRKLPDYPILAITNLPSFALFAYFAVKRFSL